MHNDNNQKNPTEDEIKHILKLIDSEKYTSAEKIAKQQIIKYSNSPILFNILGAIFFKCSRPEGLHTLFAKKKVILNYPWPWPSISLGF